MIRSFEVIFSDLQIFYNHIFKNSLNRFSTSLISVSILAQNIRAYMKFLKVRWTNSLLLCLPFTLSLSFCLTLSLSLSLSLSNALSLSLCLTHKRARAPSLSPFSIFWSTNRPLSLSLSYITWNCFLRWVNGSNITSSVFLLDLILNAPS